MAAITVFVICLFSFGSSSSASVARLYLADLLKSPSHEVFRVEGHVCTVCKVLLQTDGGMSFIAHARLVHILHVCTLIASTPINPAMLYSSHLS